MNENVSLSDEAMTALQTELMWAEPESQIEFMRWLIATQRAGVCHFLSNGGLKTAVEVVNAQPRLRTFILSMTERFIASLILKEVFANGSIDKVLGDLIFKMLGNYRMLFSSDGCLLSESYAESLAASSEEITQIFNNNPWIFVIYVVLITNQDSEAVTSFLSKIQEGV